MISIVTTYKNRRHHIVKTLPTWVQQDSQNFEIILVDYDSDDDISDILTDLYNQGAGYSALQHIRCNELPVFHLSHARNIGSRKSHGDYLLFVDIDTCLKPNAVSYLEGIMAHGMYCAAVDSQVRKDIINGGLIIVPHQTDHEIFGFNENIKGWGFEDIDYKQRLERYGLSYHYFPDELYECIDHSDLERTQCYSEEKDISWTKNRQIALREWRGFDYGNWDCMDVALYQDSTRKVTQ